MFQGKSLIKSAADAQDKKIGKYNNPMNADWRNKLINAEFRNNMAREALGVDRSAQVNALKVHKTAAKMKNNGTLADHHVAMLHAHAKNAGKLIARIKEIGGTKALQNDWFVVDKKVLDMKDVKSVSVDDRELGLLKDELKNMRESVRSITGGKPFKIKLYQLYSTNVNSSGILDVVTTIDPSPITEFISAATLYDEYKVSAFEYDFVFQNYMGTTGTGSITNGATFGYDPTDAVLLGASGAGLQAGRQLQQHKAFMPPGLTGNATYRVAHDLLRFSAKMPPGVLQNISPSTATATTNWQPTLGSSYMPYGWFKQYSATFSNPSQACTSGMLTYWVEFRCRS